MTTAEAAAALGITESLVRRYIRDEKLKASKRGRDWWITPKELERFKSIKRTVGRKPDDK